MEQITQQNPNLFELAQGMLTTGLLKVAPSLDETSWFTLKSGQKSPIYVDARLLQSFPLLNKMATLLIAQKIHQIEKTQNQSFNQIAAVPYGALGLGYGTAAILDKPVITLRKEGQKDHGDNKDYVGILTSNDTVVVIEDVATTGLSIVETVRNLRQKGANVDTVIVLLDREQGATENLANEGIRLIPLMTLEQAFGRALAAHHPMREVVLHYLSENKFATRVA